MASFSKNNSVKSLLFLLMLTFLGNNISAQVGINTNGNTAHSSAMLDISSNNKGVLIPRMNINQRTGINSPAEGLLVFDTTTKSFWYFAYGVWTDLSENDNMGDHVATQNIKMNSHWLTRSDANNGLYVNSNGKIGINTDDISSDLEIESFTPELRLTDEDPQASTNGKNLGKLSWFSRDGSFGSDYSAMGVIELINTNSSATPDPKMCFSVWNNDQNGHHKITPLTLYPSENLGISNGWLSNDGDDEGIRINNAGRIGIGTNPFGNVRLSVVETVDEGKLALFRHTGFMTPSTGFTIEGGEGDDSNLELLRISSYVEPGIGPELFSVRGNGDLHLEGQAYKTSGTLWVNPSDRRLKSNIRPFSVGLETIEQIEPKFFNYSEESGYGHSKQHIGVIAQDVLEYAPYMVGEFEKNGSTYYNVDPSAIVYIFVNAIKELSAENKELKKTLNNIEARLRELEKDIE